ncbi:type I-B CRISPR-associated protein Cas7/Csh2 [Haloglomus irregulare]|jgi:CRISPR-associated protein Csh2|uniref:Type I-B CRISPR-associated protein Cas7/Csh2 n=1 Tax=Haloglomus irregulare TaxID=2234134 RepID=A0A554N9D8_9EURY|nr:type I-B CRISPR-associated protein Cas7/Csh2 [Haloglomus irregulare]TSD13580.1 type I-B CRISPR-associated protein Cas7/Csh2 [Haloglomus irregulare]
MSQTNEIPRSEILFLTDAQDCNPNGNPMNDDRPRRDPETGQAIITDVRLKRYLRDQLADDGYDIYVKKMGGRSYGRTTLATDVLGDISDADDLDDIEDVGAAFLDAATDVRYFGATLSFNSSDDEEEEELRTALAGAFPNNYQGPVQFLPARSLNAVEENEEYDSLTSVISTGDDNRQGGFGLDDKRIVYGIFPFYGLVDGESAKDTHLSPRDVERLDTLCWRSIKNQTTSRSKVGQAPRLYLRVEYEDEHYHMGDLQNLVTLDEERSADAPRSVVNVTVDLTALVEALHDESDRIDTVHAIGNRNLSVVCDGTEHSADAIESVIQHDDYAVHAIDPYEERDLAE